MTYIKQPRSHFRHYFKNNRQEYYNRLNAVRQTGDWEGWLEFFLTGIAETADQIVETSQHIEAIFETDPNKIATLKRAGIRARAAHTLLRHKAIISSMDAAQQMGVTIQTARAALIDLKGLGIVHDIECSPN